MNFSLDEQFKQEENERKIKNKWKKIWNRLRIYNGWWKSDEFNN